MSILSLFGLSVSKVEISKPKEKTPEQKELDAKIEACGHAESLKAAERYSTWLTPTVFEQIIRYHDFLDLTWGSRRFGRLVNHVATFLDMEVAYGEFEREDFYLQLEMGFWSCLLAVIPVKKLYFNPDSEDELMTDFATWMKSVGRLTEEQMSDVISTVFHVTEYDFDENPPPFAHAFYDAMKYEEMGFGVSLDIKTLRTHQARCEVYRAYAARSITNNRQPDWLLMLQQRLGVTGFASMSVEMLNEANDGF